MSFTERSSGKLIQETVPLHDSVWVYSHVYVFGTVGVSDDRDRIGMDELSVVYEDEERIIRPSAWKYKKLEKYHAVYHIRIDSALFEN